MKVGERVHIESSDQIWEILGEGISCCVPVSPSSLSQCGAFGLPQATSSPIRYGPKDSDVLLVEKGSTVNCETLQLCPHGSCTHTESVGHIVVEKTPITHISLPSSSTQSLLPLLMPCLVVSATVRENGNSDEGKVGDRIIDQSSLESSILRVLALVFGTNERHALLRHWKSLGSIKSLALRAQGSYDEKTLRSKNYTGSNPAYIGHSAMQQVVVDMLDVKHLLVDLPSVDREDSGPDVPNHRSFFGLEIGEKSVAQARREGTTITELANLHDKLPDGLYLLALQVSPIEMDAAPSSQLFFPARLVDSGKRREKPFLTLASLLLTVGLFLWLRR